MAEGAIEKEGPVRDLNYLYKGAAASDDRVHVPAVVSTARPVTAPPLKMPLAVPAMIATAGNRAARRFLDLFAASIDNDNTRMAYYRGVCSFFAWLEQHGTRELVDIQPFHVATYLKALREAEPGCRSERQLTASEPTVKQHLTAIRMLFDWLVLGRVIAINPAQAVRGSKHVVKCGKTRALSEEQAGRL